MKNKKLQWIVLMLMVLTLLWGCGAQTSAGLNGDFSAGLVGDAYYADMKGEVSMEDAMVSNTPSADIGKSDTALPEGRKLIRRVSIEAQTKDMDALLPELEDHIASLGGYVENRNISSDSNAYSQWRTARLTIRIPSDRADAFLENVGSKANVISLNENLTDVTLDYVATESRIKALKAEEARLLELMNEAANLSELLEVEKRLTEVVADLEAVESQLRLYDNMIDYTSISLYIRQVTELSTPEDEMTVWDRISTGFMATLKDLADTMVDLFVWLIVSSPVLVVLGAVAFGVFTLIRFIRRRKAKKQVDKPAQ